MKSRMRGRAESEEEQNGSILEKESIDASTSGLANWHLIWKTTLGSLHHKFHFVTTPLWSDPSSSFGTGLPNQKSKQMNLQLEQALWISAFRIFHKIYRSNADPVPPRHLQGTPFIDAPNETVKSF
jgi:hypothetical protein